MKDRMKERNRKGTKKIKYIKEKQTVLNKKKN